MNDFIAKAQKWVNDNFIFFCILVCVGIVLLIAGGRAL